METECLVCEKTVRPLQQRLVCQTCGTVLHRICSSMSQDEFRRLKKDNQLDQWQCEEHEGDTSSLWSSSFSSTDSDDSPGQDQTLSSSMPSHTPYKNGTALSSRQTSVASPREEADVSCSLGTSVSSTDESVVSSHLCLEDTPCQAPLASSSLAQLPSPQITSGQPAAVFTVSSREGTDAASRSDVTDSDVIHVQDVTHSFSISPHSSSRDDTSLSSCQTSVTSRSQESGVSSSQDLVVSSHRGSENSTVANSGFSSRYTYPAISSIPSLVSSRGNSSGQPLACSSVSNATSSSTWDIVGSAERDFLNSSRDVTTPSRQTRILTVVSPVRQSSCPTTRRSGYVVHSRCLTQGWINPLRDRKYNCCELHGYDVRPPEKNPDIVELEPKPFFKVHKDLLQFTLFEGIAHYGSHRFRTCCFSLGVEERNLYHSVPREVAEKRYHIMLRCCVNSRSAIQPDNFPVGCVRVNGKWAQLQPVTIGCRTRSDGHPVDITSFCNIKSSNSIQVEWIPQNDKEHCLTVQFVEKLTSEDLLKTMKEQQYQHWHHTRDLIREKLLADDDGEIRTTSLRASLMCPLGVSNHRDDHAETPIYNRTPYQVLIPCKTYLYKIGHVRMSYPCIGSDCTHVQCVDAMTMLQMNEKKPDWKCLICSKPTPFNKLRINGYFMEILDEVGEEITEVELSADGSWQLKDSTKEVEQDETVNDLSESVHLIDLTESDDENIPSSPVHKTVDTTSSKTTEPVKVTRAVQPLAENRALLNSVSNYATGLGGSLVNCPSSVTSIGCNYSQGEISSYRHNNYSRGHNHRPYDRNWTGNSTSQWNSNSWRNNYSSNRSSNSSSGSYNRSRNWFGNSSSHSNYSSNRNYNSYHSYQSSYRANNVTSNYRSTHAY